MEELEINQAERAVHAGPAAWTLAVMVGEIHSHKCKKKQNTNK